MKHCLSERTLLDCILGDGGTAANLHLRECADCAERHLQLEEELADVATVLRQPPRVRRVARAVWGIPAWVSVMAVFALAGLTTLVLVHTQRARMVAPVAAVTDTDDFTRDVVAALFDGPALASLSTEPSADAYLEAAFDGGWPCEPSETADGRCEASDYSLLLDE
jgi:hypothetical protein